MPDLPSTAEIRQFLTEAFNDEELTALCFDFFPEVKENFAAGMTKQQKILALLEYCQHREVMPNLLAALQRVRPEQYKRRFPQAQRVETPSETIKPKRDPKQVFISHAHEDAEFAHRLAGDLKNGWRVWIAPESIRPGEMWGEGIDRGLDESGVLVLVLTPHAVQSRWVRKETYVAIQLESQGQIKFIPLEVEPCNVPGLWSAYQQISFRSSYASGLNALLDELEPERRAQREREAREKAAREKAEQLECEMQARRQAAQAEAERQLRLAAEKAEAERRERERIEREAQEKAAREKAVQEAQRKAKEETERQAKLAKKAEAERLERERQEHMARLQAAREAERQARLKAIPSQPEPVAEPPAAHTPQPMRRTKSHLPVWALRAAGCVLAILVLIVIASLVSYTAANMAANMIRATQTVIAARPTNTPGPTPIPGSTRIAEKDGMVMVYVPAGEFLMGSADSDKDASSDEKLQHKVDLDAFWIDRTEVTNAQYKQCVQAPKCKVSSYADDSKFNGDNQPVVGVDWNDARTYCEWAGRQLPTEAQWEKAARGTDGRIYPWGNQTATCEYAVMDDGSGNGCGKGSAAWVVGSKPKGNSPYGAFDMAGNVWEWVADWYDEKYYGSSPPKNPTGPASGQVRVLRGGSWLNSVLFVRSAIRLRGFPEFRFNDVGFRCSR
jgi:formylglycine-generating enzyme required for sulfatase activity